MQVHQLRGMLPALPGMCSIEACHMQVLLCIIRAVTVGWGLPLQHWIECIGSFIATLSPQSGALRDERSG